MPTIFVEIYQFFLKKTNVILKKKNNKKQGPKLVRILGVFQACGKDVTRAILVIQTESDNHNTVCILNKFFPLLFYFYFFFFLGGGGEENGKIVDKECFDHYR